MECTNDELKHNPATDGKPPVVCSADFDEDYFEDDEEATHHDCPKCGRTYDEIDYEYQACSKCGWDEDKQKWGESREPSDEDYMNGDADILTGRWW
jgi:ribosomal protein L37E